MELRSPLPFNGIPATVIRGVFLQGRRKYLKLGGHGTLRPLFP